MKFVSSILALLFAAAVVVPSVHAQTEVPDGTTIVTGPMGENGLCQGQGGGPELSTGYSPPFFEARECADFCRNAQSTGLLGFTFSSNECLCHYDRGTLREFECPPEFFRCRETPVQGPIEGVYPYPDSVCYAYGDVVVEPPPEPEVVPCAEIVGIGPCRDSLDREYDNGNFGPGTFDISNGVAQGCFSACQNSGYTNGLLGYHILELYTGESFCKCFYDDGFIPSDCANFDTCSNVYDGQGPIVNVASYGDLNGDFIVCYKYDESCANTEATGDPHFRTWKKEHFEFHGQCDIVMTKVGDFGGPGADLEIHLRTKIVRYWSYINTAAIRIGNDILEVEGSAEKEDGLEKRHYRINYEYRGPLKELGGFPVTISPRNNVYTIDLDSKYPGQKIQIKTFKEFVGVKIIGATEESFGKAVGITGNFKTGKTLARDGVTELHDFNDLGLEWQVMPSDGKLFHEMARPQFPELCYLPEDPRGDRTRRLIESDITEEAAEAACAGLKDDFERKGCIYDILATQDLDMAGAY